MKQTADTIFETISIILIIIGAFWLLGQLVKMLLPEPERVTVVNVTINMPNPETKELTAGDHAKGIIKIGWDKLIEGLLLLPLPWK